MISDVLSEAIDEIRDYQAELPECYESYRPMLEELLVHMDRVRAEFDRSPSTPTTLKWETHCVACGQPRLSD
jgi:hypothetical protein